MNWQRYQRGNQGVVVSDDAGRKGIKSPQGGQAASQITELGLFQHHTDSSPIRQYLTSSDDEQKRRVWHHTAVDSWDFTCPLGGAILDNT